MTIINPLYNVLPRNFWECLLVPFIIGLLTVSHIEGLSKIMILYGFAFNFLFLAYFLTHKLVIQPEVIIYFTWIIWSLCGLANAVDDSLFFVQLMTIIQMGILIFLFAGITALRQNISIIILAIAIGGTIVGLSSYYTGELQLASDMDTKTRASGMTGNANNFAYHILFVVFAVFYFWKRKTSSLWRVILLTVLFFSIIAIIYSGSRKGILAVLVFMFLWWFFCKSKKLPKNPIKVYIILLILLGGAYFITDYVMSNTTLGKRFEDKDIQRGRGHRLEMYKDGFIMIKNNPLFGVGLNNYRLLSTSGLYSHSDYIEVAANTGIVGFILYFSVYVVLWRRLNRIKLMTKDPHILYVVGLLQVAIITILFVAFGRPNITSKLTWMFLASAIGYSWSIERALLSNLQMQCRKGFEKGTYYSE